MHERLAEPNITVETDVPSFLSSAHPLPPIIIIKFQSFIIVKNIFIHVVAIMVHEE